MAQSGFSPLRVSLTILVWAVASWMLGATVLGFFRAEAPNRGSQAMLSFSERVAYQRAIEDVYWRHRFWPKENLDSKPSLDAVMSQAQLENKVSDYLRKSDALEHYWQRPITAEQLQAEMDRMATHTKQADVLRELFEALGNDPFIIAECLARPVLAERLLTSWNRYNQKFEGNLQQQTEKNLKIIAVPSSSYMLPVISDRCIEDTWTATAGEPDGRANHTAIWTGTEMIIWGGGATFGMNSGARYNPSTDTWMPTSSTNAPDARFEHTAVWTGTEMIIWGGSPVTNTGGRYNPLTDSWTGTSTINAPTARYSHVALWTGTEMIIWGGASFFQGGELNTGARYNPNTNIWTATSTTNAPPGRFSFTAAWTGTEMIVWGGRSESAIFATGGRYNPSTDTWMLTSTMNAPIARFNHSAVWTGSRMIVWGGLDGNAFFNTGGKYDPGTDTWTSTGTVNAPDASAEHSGIWTGSEMIVWGGYGNTGDLNTGGRYDPLTNSWAATSIPNTFEPRAYHTAIWTGSEMIVWGGWTQVGMVNTGARYNPNTDNWVNTGDGNAPRSRVGHSAVWTGSEMIVWGGAICPFPACLRLNTGGRYIPGIDSWTATSIANAPDARTGHTAVWTGTEMVVWGGLGPNGFSFDSGGRYDPGTDSWTPTSTTSAPAARHSHTAVWTGSEMMVWGGVTGLFQLEAAEKYTAKSPSGSTPTPTATPLFNTGARYNPNTDSWIATSTANAPTGREGHTAVWSGKEMILWGGHGYFGSNLNTGGRYNPGSDSWTPTSVTNAPEARYSHTAVWTDPQMIVWGGYGNTSLNTGGRYNPSTDNWEPTSTTNAPGGRSSHTAVSTGTEMIVWGGFNQFDLNTGGRYSPGTDTWISTSTTNPPEGRASHSAIWTGNEMIVWGGLIDYLNVVASTGGRYCVEPGLTPTPTPTATPCTGRCSPTPRPRPRPAPRP